MRISKDGCSRERLCPDLAFRFLRHEARTQTIRTWTGLSDDRIRKVLCSRCQEFNNNAGRLRSHSAQCDGALIALVHVLH